MEQRAGCERTGIFPAISVRVDGAKKKPGLEDGYISLRANDGFLFSIEQSPLRK